MKIAPSDRFWEIDFIRGIAISIVVILHILVDLNFFDIYKINVFSGFLLPITYTVASTFLLLVGLSLTLSFSRGIDHLTKEKIRKKIILRGIEIFMLGLLITIATWIYLGRGFIIFGVLHCIGISIVLSYPLLQFRFLNLFLGTIFIFLGILLKTTSFDFYWLLWLGFRPHEFYTLDYFPLLPWFGVILIGLFLGNSLYPSYKRSFNLKDASSIRFVKSICLLGRHTLIIYLIHQPIVVGIIYLLFL